MDTTSYSNSTCAASVGIEPLSLPLTDAAVDEETWEIVNAGATLLPSIAEVTIEVQQRIEMIQQVMAVRGTKRCAKVQRQAAEKLGLSVRSLRRLMRS